MKDKIDLKRKVEKSGLSHTEIANLIRDTFGEYIERSTIGRLLNPNDLYFNTETAIRIESVLSNRRGYNKSDETVNAITYVLTGVEGKVPAVGLVNEVNGILRWGDTTLINKRSLRDWINRINDSGDFDYVILSSTTKGDSGYWVSQNADEIRRAALQLNSHGAAEIKKGRRLLKRLETLTTTGKLF